VEEVDAIDLFHSLFVNVVMLAMLMAPLLAVSDEAEQTLSIFEPVSPPAEAIRQLLLFTLVIVGIIFLLVEGLLIFNLLRFRRAPGETREPAQIYGSMPIEVAWTVAPALVVFFLVLIIVRTEGDVIVPVPEPKPDDHTLHVTVIGHQWWWEYVYEAYDGRKMAVITANELHVPASTADVRRPTYLKLQSADVCHSFWVPRLAGKTDLIPGKTNSMWFRTEQTGLYLGQCAEYCGTQHAYMLLRVNVDPPDKFEQWLENEAKPAVADAKVSKGRDLFLAQSCVNCHRIRGTLAAGSYAPDLTHLMSRETLAAGKALNNRDELRRWVIDPQKVKQGCLMPAFGLRDSDVDLIVDYLVTLK
jgi:cytochrome c oxidase subunit 2